MRDREIGGVAPLLLFALALAIVLALAGCGGAPSVYTLAGEWDYAVANTGGALACKNGAVGTGTLVLYEGPGAALSGSYDICGSSTAYADLAGHYEPGTFQLQFLGGQLDVVDGVEAPGAISGRVVGLGEGVTFAATRRGGCCGKSLGPPQ